MCSSLFTISIAIAKVHLLALWNQFVAFWNTNEYTQAVQRFVVKYWTICADLCDCVLRFTRSVVNYWQKTVYPTIMKVYAPYQPKVMMLIAYAKQYGMIAYSWVVDKLVLQYEMMQKTPYVSAVADLIMYITIVMILNVLFHVVLCMLAILTFPLRCLCPCKCCKCCKCCKM